MPRANGHAHTSADLSLLNERVAVRMAENGQRYTKGRKALVELLATSVEPLDMAIISHKLPEVPQSSAYRSLALMNTLGIVTRIAGKDESGHFELSEDFLGEHHHHALCQRCGKVADIQSSPKLERALQEAATAAGEQSGFLFDAHRIDLVGLCARCR